MSLADLHQFAFVDATTHLPCPRAENPGGGVILCTRTDPDHRHISAASARTLGPPRFGIDWRTELAKADTVEDAIYTAIGAASGCWSNLEGAGVFESERAADIGEALLELVRGYIR